MADVTVHLRRNLARYKAEGDTERVKAIKARLKALEPKPAARKPAAPKPAVVNEAVQDDFKIEGHGTFTPPPEGDS
jgi:hypothetical protein